MSDDAISAEQADICRRFNVSPMAAPADLKVGISRNVRNGLVLPLNGLRHAAEGDTTGWYIWAGEELSDDSDFFVPLHVGHLHKWSTAVLPYLALPSGWRFLIAPGHEDVWFDESLLNPIP
ncbi:hypothetical protein [Kribbella sp. NPDC051718]|uniref:immunity protein Imm33 domain-containing protein n=1 Tax=Kribbella sp. NPDC051718 TaxID=3155168 RepID=UPI003431FA74